MADVDDVRAAFESFSDRNPAVEPLLDLYHPDVVFIDPIQRSEGIEAFAAMMRSFAARSSHLRFTTLRSAQDGDHLFLTWSLALQIGRSPMLTIEGCSEIELREGRIIFHRDYWDLLGSAFSAAPTAKRYLSKLTRFLA